MADALQRTPLHDRHVAAGARLVPFAGWEMPVQYEGIRAEHVAVRERAASSTSPTWARSRRRARRRGVPAAFSNDVTEARRRRRPVLRALPEDGGVLDDLFSYRLGDRFLTVTNASNHAKRPRLVPRARRGLRRRARPTACTTTRCSPSRARRRASIVAGARRRRAAPRFKTATLTVAADAVLVCGTGYTGEDGVELLVPPAARARVWDAVVAAGAEPAGLGARDTLRLEVCFHLYGNDLMTSRGPIEAGLGWCCKEDTGFIGADAVAPPATAGPAEKLVPFVLTGPGIARQGNPVVGGGEVTSGTLSPCLGVGIGMAYLPAERAAGDRVEIDVRGKPAGPWWPSPCTPGDRQMADGRYPDDLLYHPEHDWARIDGTRGVRHHLVRPGPARRDRLLRPARGRRTVEGRALRRGRVRQGGLRRHRAAVGRDRRGQPALADPERSTTTPTATAGWSRSLSDPSEVDDLLDPAPTIGPRRDGEPVHRRSPPTTCRAMLEAIGVGTSTTLFADVPAACGSAALSTCRPGLPEQEVYATCASSPSATSRTEDEISFLGGGMYDHYVPALVDMHRRARVPDAVHALPAGDLPGRPAGHVRVPDGDLRAHRPARLERLGLRGAERRRRRRLPRALATKRAGFVVSRGVHPHSRETLVTMARGWGTRSSRSPLRDGVTADALGGSATTSPRSSSSSRTSSARSRTSRRSPPPPSAPARSSSSSATR